MSTRTRRGTNGVKLSGQLDRMGGVEVGEGTVHITSRRTVRKVRFVPRGLEYGLEQWPGLRI